MNVREIISKVKDNLGGDIRSGSDRTERIELPKEDPLRRIWNYGVEGERIPISEYDPFLDYDDVAGTREKGYVPINKEDILLQDLVSNYSDEDGIPPPYFEEVDKSVGQHGIEALAYYVPFHYETRKEPWGIHLIDKGIWTVVNALDPLRKDNFTTNDLIVFGARILFWHEFFHFLTEIAASTMEITSNFRRINYHEYREKIYSGNCDWNRFRFNGSNKLSRKGNVLEEALANSYCYTQGKKEKGIAACLQEFMYKQPPGYSNYDLFPRTRKRFHLGCSTLGSLLSDTKSTKNGSPYESLFDIYRHQVTTTDVPIYLERSPNMGSAGISLFRPIPANQWHRAKSFQKELKKLGRRSTKKVGYLFENALKLAASPNKLDRSRVNDERVICRKDNLRTFEVTGSIRVFYKTCKDNRQILVGIQEHPEFSEYQKIYKSDHCGERQ